MSGIFVGVGWLKADLCSGVMFRRARMYAVRNSVGSSAGKSSDGFFFCFWGWGVLIFLGWGIYQGWLHACPNCFYKIWYRYRK